MSVRHSDRNDPDLPELGSARAAVQSCVSLIAGMSSQPEIVMAYWLDLYFQVRLIYEREQAPAPDPGLIRKEDLLPVFRQLWRETMQEILHEEAEKRVKKTIKTKAGSAEAQAGEENGAVPTAPPPMKPEDPKPEPENDKPKPSAAAEAARFKRDTRERLLAAREHGVTIAKIRDLANGALTEGVILDILDCQRVPINVYRVLAAVLDKIEKKS